MSFTKPAKKKEKLTVRETMMISEPTLDIVKPQPVETLKAVPLMASDAEKLVMWKPSYRVRKRNKLLNVCRPMRTFLPSHPLTCQELTPM